MGTVTKQYTFVAGAIPTAANWNANVDEILNEINGQLDSANVDTSSSDGIMTLDATQTVTSAKTFTNSITFSGSATFSSGLTTASTLLCTHATVFTINCSLADTIRFQPNQIVTLDLDGTTTASTLTLVARDLGSANRGPELFIGRNTTSGTKAPGIIHMESEDGSDYQLWFENDGTLRTGAYSTVVDATNDDSHGTIVGTQT